MSVTQRLIGWAVLLPVGFLAGALAAWWIGPEEAFVAWLVVKREGVAS